MFLFGSFVSLHRDGEIRKEEEADVAPSEALRKQL
jgi:hypothetical protein